MLSYNEHLSSNNIELLINNFNNGDLTDKEFEKEFEKCFYIDNFGVSNESFNFGNIKNLLNVQKDKIINWVFTFFDYLYKNIDKLKNSVVKIANTFIKTIGKVSKKYPKLFKITVIVVLIIVLLTLSASTVQAATSGNISQDDSVKIANSLIGFIQGLTKNTDIDNNVISESLSYAINLRNKLQGTGSVDLNLSQESQVLVSSAKKFISGMADNGKSDMIDDLASKGEKYLSFAYEKVTSLGDSSITSWKFFHK